MHLPRQSSSTYKKSSTVVYTRNRSTDRWSRYSTDHVVLVTYVYLWSYSNTCYSGEISVQPQLACYDEEKAVRSMSCSAALGCPKRPVAVRRDPLVRNQSAQSAIFFFLSFFHPSRASSVSSEGRTSVCLSVRASDYQNLPAKKKDYQNLWPNANANTSRSSLPTVWASNTSTTHVHMG
jgi:hypothetical protein